MILLLDFMTKDLLGDFTTAGCTQNQQQFVACCSGFGEYTIVAILLGSIAGGMLSDLSVTLALIVSFLLYGASIGVNAPYP